MSEDEYDRKIRIKPKCKATIVNWNKDTINDFLLHPRVRDIRKNHLRKLFAALNRGESFDDPVIVNLDTKSKKQTIIDGSHRYRASQQFIAQYQNAMITMQALQYTDLTMTEMNEVYMLHSKSVKQTLADRLKMERDENEIIDKLLSAKFVAPVSVSSRVEAWNLPRLLRAYFDRHNPPERATRTSVDSFMYAVKLLDFTDYNRLAEFCVMHKKVFGKPCWDNPMCRPGAVMVLSKIYFWNLDKEGVDRDILEKRFIHLQGDDKFINRGKSVDRFIVRELYDYAIERMNTHDRNKTIKEIPRGK